HDPLLERTFGLSSSGSLELALEAPRELEHGLALRRLEERASPLVRSGERRARILPAAASLGDREDASRADVDERGLDARDDDRFFSGQEEPQDQRIEVRELVVIPHDARRLRIEEDEVRVRARRREATAPEVRARGEEDRRHGRDVLEALVRR